MTILQSEMNERSKAIQTMGDMMAAGMIDITPENEGLIQEGIAAMISANEEAERMQEETFRKMPWLGRAVERRA